MFQIEFTPEAVEDLRLLRRYDQKLVVSTIEMQLQHQPDQETRNRKRLRPNQLAEWELRAGDFRVFYDIDAEAGLVKIEERRGNRLFVHGEEYEL